MVEASVTVLAVDKHVGTAKTVTLASTTYGGADVGNYAITDQATATADITAKAVTVSGITADDKVYDATTAATVDTTGITFTGLIAGDDLTASGTTGAFGDKHVGTAKTVTLASTTYGGADVGNYAITDQATATADITAKAVTVSGITADDKVYDATTAATVDTTGITFTGLIAGDDLTASGTTGAFGDKHVGTAKTVTLASTTYGGADVGNYAITDQATATADITAKAVTVSGITADDKVYDATTAATVDTTGITFTGLIAGDDLTASGTTGAFGDKHVGTAKTVTLASTTYGGADVGNYAITDQATATADITAKAVTVSGITADDKVYDATTAATVDTTGITFTGLIAGDDLTASGTTGAFGDKHVGTAKTVTLASTTYGGADVGNYAITDQATATADITAKAVTVSGITADDKVYDATTAATVDTTGITFTGLIAGDDLTASGTTGAFGDKHVGTAKTVTLASTTYGGADVGNYAITDQATATADITAKAVTVSGITADDKVYDATTAATVDTTGITFTGLIAGDDLTASGTTGAFGDKHVGTAKTVTLASTTYGGADVGNYAITDQATATADITAKAVTVSGITADDKVYDATTAATVDTTGITFTGLIAGDDLTASGTTGAFGDKHVGTAKTVTLASTTYGGADVGNYAITDQATATADITAKAVTVSGITADDKVYDATTAATVDTTGITFTGLIAGDDLTASGTTGAFGDKHVGTAKTVTLASTTYGGADVGNYAITDQATATADITAKAVTVSGITADDKVYDATTAATVDTTGITFTGLIAGDDLTASGTTGAFGDKHVGTAKTVTLASTTYGGADVGNYAITDQATATADITAKAVTVSGITADDKVYDATTAATVDTTGITFTGLIAGDDLTASGTTGAFGDKHVGTAKTVTLASTTYGGADVGNYAITDQATATADITAKAVTVSGITADDKVYDATTAATVDTTGITFTGLIAGDDLTASGTTGAFGDKHVGTAKTVTLASTTYGGADVGNYAITDQATATADITAKAVTVSGITADDKVYDATTAATVDTTGITFTGLIAGDDLTASGTTGAFGDKHVGTAKTVTLASTTYGGADVGNYAITDQATATADITAKAVTVSGITADDKVYDATTAATVDTTGITFTGLIAGDDLTASGTTGAFGDKHVGTAKTVTLASTTYGGADVGNYAITDQATATADITAKAVTVSGITADDKVYDATTAATVDTTGITFTGLIAGDDLTASGTTGAFGDKHVGTAKTVTLASTTYGGADVGNYAITDQATATADITAKAVTVSGITADDKVYDATTAATVDTTGITFTGLIAGDDLTASGTTGAFGDKHVGTAKTVTLASTTYGGADVGNYAITDQATATADITAKAVTVSGITADDKVYDATTAATVDTTGITFTGLIAGDDLTASGTTGAFGDKHVGTAKTVTLASTTYGGADVGNYAITDQATATADITAKAVTVSGITADDKVYDATTAATVDTTGITFTGLIAGDDLTASGTTGAFGDKHVGTAKTVTLASTTYGGADVGNYAITDQATATADITAKAVTVSGITADDKVYDATTAATVDTTGITFTGLIAGDDLTASGTTGAFGDKHVGTAKTVTLASTTYGGADVGNYAITDQATATADITAKAVTVSGITADDKVYDATTAATVDTTGITFTGLIAGDDLTASGTTGAFGDKHVGTAKTVTLASTTYGGADVGNYAITDQATATADITAKAVTVSGITADDKVYDATTAATVDTTGITFTGLIAGDDLTASGTTGAFGDKHVGTAKTVTLASTTYGGADVGNYAITDQATATADITAKAVTVSGITADDKVYDATTAATVDTTGITFTGLIAGDDLTASGTTGAFGDKHVGTAKTVTLASTTYGGADVGNYAITDQATATADITAKAVTVSGITADDKVYDATTAATVDTTGITFTGLIAGDDLTASGTTGAFGDKHVGTAKTVTLASTTYGGADVGNYAITDQATATADITAKAVTVSGITADDKVYDATTAATVDTTGITFTGLIAGDDLTASGTTGAFGDKHVGTAKTVTLASTTYGGADVGNYAITDQATATADITAKAVTVSGITADDKVYDATTAATVDTTGITFTGLIAGDDLTASGTTGAFGDKHVGTAKTVTLASTTYGGADVGNYAITDQATATADITAKAVTVSGITADDKVYDATTAATVDTTGITFTGLIAGDDLTASGTTGAFGPTCLSPNAPVVPEAVRSSPAIRPVKVIPVVSTVAAVVAS